MIRVKRLYEPREAGGGARFLVDRLWPRGVRKEALALDGWLKDVAPSDSLRKWYQHDPGKWEEFKRRYWKELEGKEEDVERMEAAARAGDVTLLFSSREERINNAVALREYLERRLASSKK